MCLYIAPKLFLPCVKPGHTGCSRVLHENEHDVAETVCVEFGHGRQIFRVAPTGKNLADTLFQFFGQFFETFVRCCTGQFKPHFNAPATVVCAAFRASRFSALARPSM